MKDQKARLIKKSVVEAMVAETARQCAAVSLDTLDEHLSGMPLDIVTAARRALASGKAPLQVIVSGAKRLAEKRREEIRQADRERERELARKEREKKAQEEAERKAQEEASAKERIQAIADQEEDESVKALLLASIEAPAKKIRKSTTTTTTTDKTDYAGKIRKALPGTLSEICNATGLPAEKVKHYVSHYVSIGIIGGPRKPLSSTYTYTLLKP